MTDFAIAEIQPGKLNALVKNIMRQTGEDDPNEAVRLVNAGEWVVCKSPLFSVSSRVIDGQTISVLIAQKGGLTIPDLAGFVLGTGWENRSLRDIEEEIYRRARDPFLNLIVDKHLTERIDALDAVKGNGRSWCFARDHFGHLITLARMDAVGNAHIAFEHMGKLSAGARFVVANLNRT